jgi:hypothetical protein
VFLAKIYQLQTRQCQIPFITKCNTVDLRNAFLQKESCECKVKNAVDTAAAVLTELK